MNLGRITAVLASRLRRERRWPAPPSLKQAVSSRDVSHTGSATSSPGSERYA